ncbi:type I restriction endonuclease [Nitrosomonas communis]|uniref:type I restriction endonuclease n=1 Tax=Nitrosomonas communis TaxID=44574 RepID=UPI0026F12D9F|nr:type I restriction endonuclease [Nitrosomonas communis]MCO6428855.1 type I restriction enzyme HsdR N-terminal domain-containing protein [Nitrosomonas communis]
MDLIDQLKELALRIRKIKDTIQTEEATKNALIMPFIQILGYNVFDPTEVTPELIADIGIKKGEKVDYAILMNDKPIMLFECKKSGSDLSINHASQLLRYFHVKEARFGVLTNGISYQFFTDLEQPNRMDEKPFFEFNILDFKDQHVEELKKFTKSAFNVEQILSTASDLKYTRAIRNVLAEWMVNPSEDFVRIVCAEVHNGKRFTPAIKEQFTQITKNAFHQFIGEKINERLKMAMEPATEVKTGDLEADDITTTAEELEAFRIIRAILREIIEPKRVVMRDAKSYCAILCDDNNRRPICRLRFNNPARMMLGLFDEKEEKLMPISDLSDIYQYADQLKKTASMYIKQNEPSLQEVTTT